MATYFLWGGLACVVAFSKFIGVLDLVGAILMGVGLVLLIMGR
jgi:hypothetical protein